MDVIGLAARVVLGLVLLFAGFAKVRSRRWPLLALEAGTPRWVVLTLPAFELLLGIMLVSQVAAPVAAWLGLLLFLAFLGVVTYQYTAGIEAPCNCFGGDGESVISRVTIVRNGFLVALAILGVVGLYVS